MQPKFVLVTLLLIGLLIYQPSLNAGFILDDQRQIVHNTSIRSLANIPSFFHGSTFFSGGAEKLSGTFYRPMMMVFYTLTYAVFGPGSFGFHLVQILLHSTVSFLVYLFFSKHFSSMLSATLGLLFLVHPVNVETTVYLADLQDVLFVFFGLLVLIYLQSIPQHKKVSSIVVFLLLTFALLSKETAVMFLVLIPVFYSAILKKSARKIIKLAGIVLLLYLLLKVNAVGLLPKHTPFLTQLSLPSRVIMIPAVVNHYLATYVVPGKLTLFSLWELPQVAYAYIPLVALLVLLLYLYLRLQSKKEKKLISFFSLWFGMGLLLHSQLIPLDATVADRWFYAPQIGLLGLLGIGLQQLIKNKYKLTYATLIILLILLALKTTKLQLFWKDEMTLVTHSYSLDSENFLITNALGYNYLQQGDLDNAALLLEKSINLAPEWGSAWNNLGYVYYRQGHHDKALEAYSTAYRYMKGYLVYANKAQLLLDMNEWEQAREWVREGLELYPNNPQLWYFYSMASDKMGKNLEANQAYDRYVQLNNH